MTTVGNFIKALEQFKVIFPYAAVEYNDNFWIYDESCSDLQVEPISYLNTDEVEWNYGFETKGGFMRADGYFIVNVYDGSGGEFTMILNEAKECKEEIV